MPSVTMVNGKTSLDYFHFVCGSCGETMHVSLNTSGHPPTIAAKCESCGAQANLKLYLTFRDG